MSLLRYPGGKQGLLSEILKRFPKDASMEYREPFLGGGSVALGFLEWAPEFRGRVWVNDYDPGVAALWTAVIRYPNSLKNKVRSHENPKASDFKSAKQELEDLGEIPQDKKSVVEAGFQKLLIHRVSYSGLGYMAGSVQGGRQQKSRHSVTCRWNPLLIRDEIKEAHDLFSRTEVRERGCTQLDFSKLVEEPGDGVFIYLDPPYYKKGEELYREGFVGRHSRLARLLRETPHRWLLSYDDHPVIRNLYRWANIEVISANYSITGARKKGELLISPEGQNNS